MIKTSILFENNNNNNMIPEGLVLSSLASRTPCHLDMDPVKLRSPGPQRGTQGFHKAWLSNVQCTHRLRKTQQKPVSLLISLTLSCLCITCPSEKETLGRNRRWMLKDLLGPDSTSRRGESAKSSSMGSFIFSEQECLPTVITYSDIYRCVTYWWYPGEWWLSMHLAHSPARGPLETQEYPGEGLWLFSLAWHGYRGL